MRLPRRKTIVSGADQANSGGYSGINRDLLGPSYRTFSLVDQLIEGFQEMPSNRCRRSDLIYIVPNLLQVKMYGCSTEKLSSITGGVAPLNFPVS